MSKIKYLLQRYTFFFFYIINSKLNYKYYTFSFKMLTKLSSEELIITKKSRQKSGFFTI